jgi:hypothetical protein
MEPHVDAPKQPFLDDVRRHRAELRESISALEHALAAPAPGNEERWVDRVHVALIELSADFRVHVDITEGPQGLYGELRSSAPRLSGTVDNLMREHEVITGLVDKLLTEMGTDDVAGIREQANELLGTMLRHRQRGSDLVYEAYAVDIGGET